MLKNKNPAFKDGVVKIYEVENIASPGDLPKYQVRFVEKLCYDDRTVGFNRYYAAMQENVRIDLLLRCPSRRLLAENILVAVPVDGQQYKVVQIQMPEDITPPVMDLSLERVKVKYAID